MADFDPRQAAAMEAQLKELQATMATMAADINAQYKEAYGHIAKIITAKEQIAAQDSIELELKSQLLSAADQLIKQIKTETNALDRKGKLTGQIKDDLEKMDAAAKRLGADLVGAVAPLKATAKASEEVLDNLTDTEARAEKFMSTMFGIDKATRSIGKELVKDGKLFTNMINKSKAVGKHMASQMDGAALAGKTYETAMGKAESFLGGVQSYISSITEMFDFGAAMDRAFAFEDELRMHARQVGILSKSEATSHQNWLQASGHAVGVERAAMLKSFTQMRIGSTAFRQANKEGQQAAMKTAAILERRLAVSGDKTAGVFQNLVTVFGESGAQANKLSADLALLAQRQGQDVNQVFTKFNSMAGTLAKFSLPDVTKEFNRLNAMAEKTGASINGMMGMLEKFSTFEGALDASAKLNAAFGTTIDGMELMDSLAEGGPAEGILLLRDRLDATSESFKDMNFFQRRLLEQTLGTDPATLSQFMTTPYEDLQAAVDASDGSITSLGESMQAIQADADGMRTAAEEAAILQDKQREVLQDLVELLYDIKKWWAANGGFITDFFSGIAWILEGIVGSIKYLAEAGASAFGWIGDVTGMFSTGDTGSGKQWGEMASGHPGVQGGTYMVGETGREKITLPEGASVEKMNYYQQRGSSDQGAAQPQINSAGGTASAGNGGNITLNLTLVDSEGKIVAKKEFTRLIDGYMEENLNFSYS